MASIGFEGSVIPMRDHYIAQGATGIEAYLRAVIRAYFRGYRRITARVSVDGAGFQVENLLSLMVVKQPYYGFGMKVVPKARLDDRQLHILCINSGLVKSAIGGATAFTIGNRIGRYLTDRHLHVKAEQPVVSQIDGSEGWEADAFAFRVLSKALKIKC